ncbi:MAG TPA: hypothetical protein VKU00_33245 [Chthonomonadaceae bacterium]|nr:hypothetical protein [Chthonomonadaceae bacterium]
MSRRPRVFPFLPLILLAASLAAGLLAGCAQKQEATAVPPPAAPAADAKQYPPDYVQQRTARERPMPMNTDTGK